MVSRPASPSVLDGPLRAGVGEGLPPRPTRARVDLRALEANWAAFRALAGRGVEVICVLKSNAYGHGASEVASRLERAGACRLAVFSLQEGAALREAGVELPVVLLGPSLPADAPWIVSYRLTPSITSLELAEALCREARGPVPVHLKVDTGMCRYGVPPAQALALAEKLRRWPAIHLEGVFTHLAFTGAGRTAGGAWEHLRGQLLLFRRFLAALEARGIRVPLRHAASTRAAVLLPRARFNAVRIGGGLYGLGVPPGGPPVEPVLSLTSRIVQLKTVPAGSRVGYGGQHVCSTPARLALVAAGYGDGILREISGGGAVLVRGRRAPVAGRISMNQLVADVTEIDGVRLGDEVVLLGGQGEERISAEEIAGFTGGSSYEVTARLGDRLPREILE